MPEKLVGRCLLGGAQASREGGADGCAYKAPVLDVVADAQSIQEAEQPLLVTPGDGDGRLVHEALVDDARFPIDALAHRLCAVEFGVAERGEPPDPALHGGRQTTSVDKEHVGLRYRHRQGGAYAREDFCASVRTEALRRGLCRKRSALPVLFRPGPQEGQLT